MAPAPKAPGQRVRRNKDQPQWKTLPAAAAAERRPAPDHWSASTQAWWYSIWDSPMASLWIESDVPNLYELGELIELPRKSAMHYAEIRQMKANYGLTPAARKSLMWNIPAEESSVDEDSDVPVSNVRKLRAV